MTNVVLYALTVLFWGTSWIAVKVHLGVVPLEVSVAYRFLIAAAVMLALSAALGRRLRFRPSQHAWLAFQGVLLFSGNYLFVYQGTQYLTSGLVSVVFSSMVVMNIVFDRALFGQPLRPRIALGALVGLGGIAVVFWPDIAAFDSDRETSAGLAWVLGGTALASLGMLTSGRNQRHGIAVLEGNAVAMTYGAIFVTGYVMALGLPFTFDPQPRYWGALLFLALFASVAAFWAYLTLLGRIGADRAGYATVMFPVVAIVISMAVEDYQPDIRVWAGIVLVLGGNVLILSRKRPPDAAPAREAHPS